MHQRFNKAPVSGCCGVLAADIYLDYADELISDIVTDSRIDGAMFVSGDQ